MTVDKRLLAPCGLYCGVCSILIANRDNNQKFKERLAPVYGCSPEEIICRGCLSDELFGYCQTCTIRSCVLEKKYEPGLLGLDGFSHVYVFWWFDRNDTPEGRAVLQVHPRGDRKNPLTGVFATRSPRRPNLIAMTLCKIVAVKENVVEVEKIDAFDGTPVLDMKPFLPGYDTAEDAKVPDWVGGVSR